MVCRSPLLFGESGDELAAEGKDIWDHAAPDRVKWGYGWLVSLHHSSLGIMALVLRVRLDPDGATTVRLIAESARAARR